MPSPSRCRIQTRGSTVADLSRDERALLKAPTMLPEDATLRDYFAGCVLGAVIDDLARVRTLPPDPLDDIADLAYQIADAMLARRMR